MNTEDAFKLKKRLMFIKSDDVYFIAYNILLLLSDLGCSKPGRPFKDYRKLSFLIEFIADARLLEIIDSTKVRGKQPNSSDRHTLALAHSRGASRQHHVMRVICALETRGILAIERGNQSEGFDLVLIQSMLPADFLVDELFEAERNNIRLLRRISPQIRVARLDTMLEQLFGANGVETWHV